MVSVREILDLLGACSSTDSLDGANVVLAAETEGFICAKTNISDVCMG